MVAGPRGDLRGRDQDRRPGRQRDRAARPRHRDGVPELRALPAPDGVRQHRLRPAAPQGAEGRRSTSASRRRRGSSTSRPFLDRKPRALSGGQRQRVAMGRAIVRQPAAFLMDEPLSNLDAKLRVQMRAEISKLQRDLGVTTIYVTHDQVEAMTMGDRVAVMRKGELQQVAPPQELYDQPLNLFVGGFIGSPAMNLLEGRLERENGGLVVALGDARLQLDDENFAARPALKHFEGEACRGRDPAGAPRGRGDRTGRAGRPPPDGPRRAPRGARLRADGALRDRRASGDDRGGAGARRGRGRDGGGPPGRRQAPRGRRRPLRRRLEGAGGA